jgi:hypothetical protein
VKEIETTQQTPEQLLTIIEAQLALKRQSRAGRRSNRTVILLAGVMLIIVGAAVALLVLQQLLERREGPLELARSAPVLDLR